ncbi:MAG: hypothetical protein ISN26_01110, partial [Betaproteobacteria bacterium AqS2]|nr:hypothetical protein [Betaproteobacteria bacterium AqS2]
MIPKGAARLLGRMPALLAALLLAAAAATPAWAQPSGWTQGDQHDEDADDGFTVAGLNSATSDTDTGLRFQQLPNNCGSVRLRLGGGSQDRFAYYYYNDDTRQSGPYRLDDFRAPLRDNFHFRLYFRDQYSSFQDGIARITMEINSFGCSGGTPGTRNLVWQVEVIDAWATLASHSE